MSSTQLLILITLLVGRPKGLLGMLGVGSAALLVMLLGYQILHLIFGVFDFPFFFSFSLYRVF